MAQKTTWAIKYRPTNLNTVLGQEFPIRIIRGALNQEDRPPTWLLQGPWGAGKTSIARILAKSLICKEPSPNGEACCRCEQCRYIDEEQSANYSEVDSASFGHVEDMRSLIEEARLAPIDAPMRVVVLDEAHLLTKTAQGALLKTLEDGVGQTAFILVTTDPEKLLPAIKSRCIRVNLSPVDRQTVVHHLEMITKAEGVEAEVEALQLIVEHTYGHIRDALNYSQQMSLAGPLTLEGAKKHLNLHIDELAANVIVICGENWSSAVADTETIAQENAPEEIWASMRRSVVQATLVNLNPIKEKLVPAITKMAEAYAPRLTSAAEWVLGEGGKLQVRTTADIVVALAILREKLGANHHVKVEGVKRLGLPRRTRQEVSFGRVSQPMTPDELISGLMLKPDIDTEIPDGSEISE